MNLSMNGFEIMCRNKLKENLTKTKTKFTTVL